MHLYLIRHGKSEGSGDECALTPQGSASIEKIATHVTAIAPCPAKLFSSPLLRAQQTAAFFQQGWDLPIEQQDWLLPGASPSDVLAQLSDLGETDCALVGHLPNLGLLLSSLVWGTPPQEIVIPKGGVAYLTLPSWEASSATLKWLLTTDAIG